ncbi:MAG: YceI family protein [Ferruginibacter sp.]
MKKINTNIISIFSLGIVLFFSGFSNLSAQAKYHAQSLDVTVSGTSSLHDWDMKSSKGQFDANISMTNEKVVFTVLSFSIPAESLKSGHGMMDKNTYKALKTSVNPNISFVLSSGNVTALGSNNYLLKGMGKLTISGTTLLTDLEVKMKYNPADKSFSCTGIKKFKMSEYGVKPPTVMMGTIKTGDAISIAYNLTIKS